MWGWNCTQRVRRLSLKLDYRKLSSFRKALSCTWVEAVAIRHTLLKAEKK
jgi:hypothetical protein